MAFKKVGLRSRISISVFLFTSVLAQMANADVVTFEDLYQGYDTYGQLPTGYDGFHWNDSAYYVTNGLVPGTGLQYGTTGNVSVFDNNGGNLSMSSHTAFNFGSADITSAWNTNQSVVVEGFRHGVLVDSATITTSYTGPTTTNFNFLDVNSVVFVPQSNGVDAGLGAGGGNQIAVDNISFTAVSPVPEPSTYLLFGAGLLAMIAFMKRKNSSI